MPTISFAVTAAQGLLLLDAFRERHPNYDGPPLTDLQKAKMVIIEVMTDWLLNFKKRQATAAVDDSDVVIA